MTSRPRLLLVSALWAASCSCSRPSTCARDRRVGARGKHVVFCVSLSRSRHASGHQCQRLLASRCRDCPGLTPAALMKANSGLTCPETTSCRSSLPNCGTTHCGHQQHRRSLRQHSATRLELALPWASNEDKGKHTPAIGHPFEQERREGAAVALKLKGCHCGGGRRASRPTARGRRRRNAAPPTRRGRGGRVATQKLLVTCSRALYYR